MAHPDRSLPDPHDVDDPLDRQVDSLAGLRPVSANVLADRWEDLRQRLLASPGRAVALVLGVVTVGAVGWWFLRPPAPPVESTLPLASADGGGAASGSSTPAGSGGAAAASTTSTTSVASTSLVVQAAGAVNHGGVFHLPPGARVDDLIRSAGGMASDADADRVNLAAPLSDGERVWVPRRGELSSPEVVAGGGGAVAGSGSFGSSGSGSGGSGTSGSPAIVNLNTASAEELDTLPGVGPATAAAILAYRSEHGQFSSVDDLLEVRGIGDAKLEALRASVTV